MFSWANITWLDLNLPFNENYQDCYYHPQGYLESCYVSLLESSLFDRKSFSPYAWVIGEIGFGFGVNFLAAADLFQKRLKRGSPLVFISCEQTPVRIEDLKKAHSRFPQLSTCDFTRKFYESYHSLCPGVNIRFFPEENIFLILYLGKAETFFEKAQFSVDHWMFDGFNPQSNPDCWAKNLLIKITQNSNQQATFGTFTAQGRLRRELQDLGWQVEKRKGFDKKRHCLKGRFLGISYSKAKKRRESAFVTGTGVSGLTTAYFLSVFGIIPYCEKKAIFQASDVPYLEGIPAFHQHLCQYTVFNIQSWSFSSHFYHYLAKSGLARIDFGVEKTVKRESFVKKLKSALKKDFFQDIFIKRSADTVFFPRGFRTESHQILTALQWLTNKSLSLKIDSQKSYQSLKDKLDLLFLCDPFRASYWEKTIDHPSLLRGQLSSFIQNGALSWKSPTSQRYDFSIGVNQKETQCDFVGFRTLSSERIPLFSQHSKGVYSNLYHGHRGYSSAPYCALIIVLEALGLFSYQREENTCL